jgi:hypothetical protein
MPIPNEGNLRNVVCGCDGLTYWNASVAGHQGMAVKSIGECSPGKTCGGIGGLQCPSGSFCNHRVKNSSGCNLSDAAGTCWVLPATCPSILIGPNTRACGSNTCTAECQLIKSEKTWYTDNSCPQ